MDKFYIPDTVMNDTSNTPAAAIDPKANELTTMVQNDLDDLINTASNPTKKSDKIEFGGGEDIANKKIDKQKAILEGRKIPKRITTVSVLLILLLGLGYIGFLFYQYLGYQETGKVSQMWASKMPWVEKNYLSIIQTLHLQEVGKYSSKALIPTNASNKATLVSNIIDDTSLDFLAKKKALFDGVTELYKDTAARYDAYDSLKKEVGQQGFFPKDIQSLAKGVFFENSLQKAIISIESVRFATALKFFSVLDSFLTQLSSYRSMSKDLLSAQLDSFVQRGEKDINNYITSCYLNGYEISSSCSTIGDFANYYRYLDSSSFDQKLFLTTMDTLEAKLENTDFPSLDISMKNIDPLNNTISLNVELNTFKDDEVQLTTTKGILNPHIYLVTTIINHLRESRYVLTDSINVNSLKVTKKKIKVGGQLVTVNSSSFNFSLPLQKDIQREIYDFTDIQDLAK